MLNRSVIAGFVFEPSLGYSTGIVGQSDVPTISTRTYLGGARLGLQFGSLGLGFDSSIGFGKAEQFDNSGDFKPVDLGAFVSYKLPLRFKAYGSSVSSTTKLQSSENPLQFTGQSYRFGLGWSGLGFCTLLFEGIYRSYTKYGGTSLSDPIKGLTLGGSLSLPIPGDGSK